MAIVWLLRAGFVVILLSNLATMQRVLADAPLSYLPNTAYGVAQLILNPLIYLAVAEALAVVTQPNFALRART